MFPPVVALPLALILASAAQTTGRSQARSSVKLRSLQQITYKCPLEFHANALAHFIAPTRITRAKLWLSFEAATIYRLAHSIDFRCVPASRPIGVPLHSDQSSPGAPSRHDSRLRRLYPGALQYGPRFLR